LLYLNIQLWANAEGRSVVMDYRVCFYCKKNLHFKGFEEKLKDGTLRRMLVRGEFKTFHRLCFRKFALENEEWYLTEEGEKENGDL